LRHAAAGASAKPLSVRVLTVNTHKGFTPLNRRFILHELREAVRSVSADIVFLQEVLGTHVRHPERFANWPQAPHYEFLADSMWSDFAYGRNSVYPHGHHGNAVLSKFPISRYQNHDVSIERSKEKRGLLHCVLTVPHSRTEVHVVCVHLGLRESHRRHQLQLLCELVELEVPRDAPLVIAGDFNDWRLRAHEVLQRCGGLREIYVDAHGHAARTFPARWPVLRLDRIYVRNARAHRPLALPPRPWSHLSDHSPLAAEITV
jgi:endonuclease/exonuclease/phosphatase family metal-dependent hydrolase